MPKISLYEINDEYERALNTFHIDEETGELIFDNEAIEKNEADFKTKIDNLACYIKDLNALSESIKAEKSALDERLKANDKKVEALKKYLGSALEMRGMDKFETARNKLSFRKSTSVVVNEDVLLPKEYIKTVVTEKVDKKAIGDALKNGAVIYGCYLKETNNLQIK